MIGPAEDSTDQRTYFLWKASTAETLLAARELVAAGAMLFDAMVAADPSGASFEDWYPPGALVSCSPEVLHFVAVEAVSAAVELVETAAAVEWKEQNVFLETEDSAARAETATVVAAAAAELGNCALAAVTSKSQFVGFPLPAAAASAAELRFVEFLLSVAPTKS